MSVDQAIRLCVDVNRRGCTNRTRIRESRMFLLECIPGLRGRSPWRSPILVDIPPMLLPEHSRNPSCLTLVRRYLIERSDASARVFDRLVQGVAFVAIRWRCRGVAHEVARRRSGIKYFIIYRKYPTPTNRVDQNEVPWNELTDNTDLEGSQTIQKQYPGIPSYSNHVMYFPGQ